MAPHNEELEAIQDTQVAKLGVCFNAYKGGIPSAVIVLPPNPTTCNQIPSQDASNLHCRSPAAQVEAGDPSDGNQIAQASGGALN